MRDLVRNPLLIAVVTGILTNGLGITPIPVVNDFAAIVGRAVMVASVMEPWCGGPCPKSMTSQVIEAEELYILNP